MQEWRRRNILAEVAHIKNEETVASVLETARKYGFDRDMQLFEDGELILTCSYEAYLKKTGQIVEKTIQSIQAPVISYILADCPEPEGSTKKSRTKRRRNTKSRRRAKNTGRGVVGVRT